MLRISTKIYSYYLIWMMSIFEWFRSEKIESCRFLNKHLQTFLSNICEELSDSMVEGSSFVMLPKFFFAYNCIITWKYKQMIRLEFGLTSVLRSSFINSSFFSSIISSFRFWWRNEHKFLLFLDLFGFFFIFVWQLFVFTFSSWAWSNTVQNKFQKQSKSMSMKKIFDWLIMTIVGQTNKQIRIQSRHLNNFHSLNDR